MRPVVRPLLLALAGCVALTACPVVEDSGSDTSIDTDVDSTDPDTDSEADTDPDTEEPSVAFWELSATWTTRLRDKAEIPQIYIDHRGWVVVYADNDGQRGEELFHTRVSQFNSNRILLDNPNNWVARQDLHLAVYDDQGIGNEFDPADPLIIDRDGNPMEAAVNLHFISSTTVEDSDYYYDNCTIEQFEDNRTDLPIDCRCNQAQQGGQPLCWPPGVSYREGYEWAEGPRMADVNNLSREAGGGFVDLDTREYVMTMNWNDATYTSSAGAIWGVDVDTGERRVISGVIDTPTGYVTVGGGYDSNVTVSGVLQHTAPLPYIWDVKVGPDGFWYTYASSSADNVEIIRVDPNTGDRTLVWHVSNIAGDHEEFGQCERFPDDPADVRSIQYVQRSFTMDPDGNFYLSFRDSSFGDGIVRIDADGMDCTPIMRIHGADDADDIGGGANFQSQPPGSIGWVERADEDPVIILFTTLGNRLYSVDPDSGDRVLISSVDDQVGSGLPAIGMNWFIWDEETDLLFTAGGNSELFVVIDMDTGDRQSLLALSSDSPLLPGGYPETYAHRGPTNGGTWSHSMFYWHPDNRDHIAFAINGMSMAMYEIHTGNNYTFSM